MCDLKMYVVILDVIKLNDANDCNDIYEVHIEYINGFNKIILCDSFVSLIYFLIKNFIHLGFGKIELGFLNSEGLELSKDDVRKMFN